MKHHSLNTKFEWVSSIYFFHVREQARSRGKGRGKKLEAEVEDKEAGAEKVAIERQLEIVSLRYPRRIKMQDEMK